MESEFTPEFIEFAVGFTGWKWEDILRCRVSCMEFGQAAWKAATATENERLRAQVAQLRRNRALVHSAMKWIAVHASWSTSHVEEWYAHRNAALAATAPTEASKWQERKVW